MIRGLAQSHHYESEGVCKGLVVQQLLRFTLVYETHPWSQKEI